MDKALFLSPAKQQHSYPMTPDEAAVWKEIIEQYAQSDIFQVEKSETESGWSYTFTLKHPLELPAIFPQQLDPDFELDM